VNHKTRYVQAGVAFVASIAAYLLVPLDVLLPIAWASLAIGVGGTFAVKRWLERHAAAGTIDAPGRRHFWEEIGLAFAIVALMAFLILIFEYGD
jgi:hypothetical protein